MATESNNSNNTTALRDQHIIYESTPDGDIRTIVKEDHPKKNSKDDDNNNGGAVDSDLFQHHLRESWDDEYEGVIDVKDGDGGGNNKSAAKAPPQQQQQQQQQQKKSHNRHKHNLSVQFFDISISDDTTTANDKGTTSSGQQQQPKNDNGVLQKETSISTITTTTPMDVNIAPPPTSDTASSPQQHARTKSTLEVEAAAAYYFENDDEVSSPQRTDRAKNDDIANFQKKVHSSWESGDEEEEEDDDNENEEQSYRSAKRSHSKPSPRHRHNLSVQFTDDSFMDRNSFLMKDDRKGETGPSGNDAAAQAVQPPATSMSNREASQFNYGQMQQQQQQQRPQPPAPPAGIVVPVPIVVRPSINRKHHRVYSGRSNPAMAHRRVNTRGDSAPAKEEAWDPTTATESIPPPHSNLPPPPPPHHPPPPHPALGHPHPPPYYHRGTPPPQPYGTVPTPPPYDPYYAVAQPVDPRYYAAPSPHHYNSSPVSDAEVNYNARASPLVYPSPSGGEGQCPPSAHSSPGGYYADQTSPPPYAANPYARPPNCLSQPSLEREQLQQLTGDSFRSDKNLAFSDRSKENSNDTGNVSAAHHRNTSSLGDFLEDSGFEDLFDDGGYDSAPDEVQQSKRHNKSLSSASFLRSLSSDNFLKDHLEVVEEEQHKVGNSPYASPLMNSTPNSTGGAYHQPYPSYPGSMPGYYPYGPPQSTSQWQQPNNYLQHSPIKPLPSSQQRPLFGGDTVQTQFPSPPSQERCFAMSTPSSDSADGSGQDSGKRQRRKCSMPDCPNRVVQGGFCISHGAKRKTCAHPGCEKNVKAKGFCSTHGPARKRCNAEGCAKVAVQGGRCIAHGAKKKVCAYSDCAKQAILGGMCKKHHDETHGVVKVRGSRKPKDGSPTSPTGKGKPGHERGLSLFTDTAIVDSIIRNASAEEQHNDGAF